MPSTSMTRLSLPDFVDVTRARCHGWCDFHCQPSTKEPGTNQRHYTLRPSRVMFARHLDTV